MEQFQVIGYYLCETNDTPQWIPMVGKRVLSVSGCIGEQHPKLECFMSGWSEGERQEYQKYLKLNQAQYEGFCQTARRLFDQKKMDVDCRFLRLSDARDFHKRFCSEIDCRIVSISTTPKYFAILEQELKGGNSYGLMSGNVDNSLWIGSDILGWDIAGFHSFLCNSLQLDLPGAKFNDAGLLENRFEDVIRYAERIQGLGEPVEWLPCKVGVYE